MFIHTDTAVDTDSVFVRFKCSTKGCPYHDVITEDSVTNIVECGNPLCESCEGELSSLGIAFIR